MYWLGFNDVSSSRNNACPVYDHRLSALAFTSVFVQTKTKKFPQLLDLCREEAPGLTPFDEFLLDFQDKCLVTSLVRLPAVRSCPISASIVDASAAAGRRNELRVIDQCQKRVYEGMSQRCHHLVEVLSTTSMSSVATTDATRFDTSTLAQAVDQLSVQLNFLATQADLGLMMEPTINKVLVHQLTDDYHCLSTEVFSSLASFLSKMSQSLERQGSDARSLLNSASVTSVLKLVSDLLANLLGCRDVARAFFFDSTEAMKVSEVSYEVRQMLSKLHRLHGGIEKGSNGRGRTGGTDGYDSDGFVDEGSARGGGGSGGSPASQAMMKDGNEEISTEGICMSIVANVCAVLRVCWTL